MSLFPISPPCHTLEGGKQEREQKKLTTREGEREGDRRRIVIEENKGRQRRGFAPQFVAYMFVTEFELNQGSCASK